MFTNAFEGINSKNVEIALEGLISALNDKSFDDEIIRDLNNFSYYSTTSMRKAASAMNKLEIKKNKLASTIYKYRGIPAMLDTYKATYNSAKNAYRNWQKELNKDDDRYADRYERIYLNLESKCSQIEDRIRSIVGG